MKKSFLLFLIMAAVIYIQTNFLDQLAFHNVKPDIALIILIYISLRENPAKGVAIGFFSGLLEDFLSLAPLGFHSFIKTLTGFLSGLLGSYISVNSRLFHIITVMFLTFLKYLVASFLIILFSIKQSNNPFLSSVFLIELFYNALLAPFTFHCFKLGRIPIHKEISMGLGRSENIGQDGLYRIIVLGAILFCVFLLILIRLFSIQIVNQMVYSRKAQEVSQRSTVIPAQRGRIFDRIGDTPIVDNIESFSLYIIPAESQDVDPKDTVNRLFEFYGEKMDLKKILEEIPTNWNNYYLPVDLVSGIDFEDLVPIAEEIEKYPGVHWENRPSRYYNETGSISHILGYVGKITLEELQILYNKGYSNDSVIGKSGIEKIYDTFMKGEDGIFLKTVDVRGRDLESNDVILPENGYDLQLTIDRHIQTLAEKALGPRKGSVIVLKPATGEVVALVSYPHFDPNLFYSEGEQNYRDLSLDRDYPFLDRAIQSAYAPASTFKVLMTLALLAEGFDPQTNIYCSGSMTLGDREFHCHKKTGHGSLNLYEALAESCNVYFGTVGVEVLGIDKITHYSELLGLGSPSGIDLTGEISGVVPSPQWKEQTYHTRWTGGDTLNTSIGQGYLTVTPLQMANMVSIIVNDGVLYKPHILKNITEPQTGKLLSEHQPEVLIDISHEIDPLVFKKTRDAMRGVVLSGTAKVAILNNVTTVSGKTGTGEIGTDENFHAWFVSFAPYDTENKKDVYVVVTQVEAYNQEWDWWAIKAADMIYQGIFSGQNYEEVVEGMRKRGVWYVRDIPQEVAP